MAYNCASAIFLFALVFAASNTLANGQNLTLGGLTVSGRLCCTPTGNCAAGSPGINGTRVTVNCTTILGTTVTAGQGITNANGSFNITVGNLLGVVLGLPMAPCVAIVQLPLNSTICPVLSTVNGVLVSALQSIGTLLTSLFGFVQNFALTGFLNVRVPPLSN